MTDSPEAKCLGTRCGISETCARFVEKADGHEMITITPVAQGAGCRWFVGLEEGK